MLKCVALSVKITHPTTKQTEWRSGLIPPEERENPSFNLIKWGIKEKLIPFRDEGPRNLSQFRDNLTQFLTSREQQAELYAQFDVPPIPTWTPLIEPIQITGEEIDAMIRDEVRNRANFEEHREPCKALEEAVMHPDTQEWLNNGKILFLGSQRPLNCIMQKSEYNLGLRRVLSSLHPSQIYDMFAKTVYNSDDRRYQQRSAIGRIAEDKVLQNKSGLSTILR